MLEHSARQRLASLAHWFQELSWLGQGGSSQGKCWQGRISACHGDPAIPQGHLPRVTPFVPSPHHWPHTSWSHRPGSQGGAGMRVQWIDQLFLGLAGRIILINTALIAAAPQERGGMPASHKEKCF